MNRRSAHTLIELMIVMSIAVVIMGLASQWIHESLSAASRMRSRASRHKTLIQLSRDLRDAVHAGESLKVDENELLIETNGRSRTTFRIAADQIIATRSFGQAVSQEAYALADDQLARWDTSELPEQITLEIFRTPSKWDRPESSSVEPSVGSRLEMRVRSGVARWERLGIPEKADR
ncbi:MAG: prepilin-type N-terminal cleavage/methylation domain-containing protein [Planctomycetota bacterium]